MTVSFLTKYVELKKTDEQTNKLKIFYFSKRAT